MDILIGWLVCVLYALTLSPIAVAVFSAMTEAHYKAKKKYTVDMAILMAKAAGAGKEKEPDKGEPK